MAKKQEQQPARPGLEEVAPGVLRVQLPIQFTGLGHVNTYLIPQGDSVAVVDAGFPSPKGWRALTGGVKEAGYDMSSVGWITVTHSHPDHFGMAVRLAKESGAPIVTHDVFRVWWARPTEGEDPEEAEWRRGNQPWRAPGERLPTRRRLRRWLMRKGMRRLKIPRPNETVADGEELPWGGWLAIHTPGHTADHLCLFDREHGTLLSGDHVLPTITPHIAGIGAGRDPLADFGRSLHKVAELAGVRTVLPAHGLPFDNLRERVASIRQHHLERLEQLRRAAARLGPSTTARLSEELFRPRLQGSMAESETYAHLQHLVAREEGEWQDRDGLPHFVLLQSN